MWDTLCPQRPETSAFQPPRRYIGTSGPILKNQPGIVQSGIARQISGLASRFLCVHPRDAPGLKFANGDCPWSGVRRAFEDRPNCGWVR